MKIDARPAENRPRVAGRTAGPAPPRADVAGRGRRPAGPGFDGGRIDLAARPSSGLAIRLTVLVVALYALTFSIVSLQIHDSFQTNAFDLGNLDQAVWNTAQGRWFEFTNWSGGTTRLAAHVEPILIPLAGIYWLWSSPKALLILQSVALALGALPAFWIARQRLGNDFAAFAFAAAYLFAPELQAANLRDFHPVVLAAPLLLFAFACAERDRWVGCFAGAILAMATKEQVPLSVGLIGLYVAIVRRRRIGWALGGVAALWFVVAVGIVLPAFNSAGGSPYLSRYSHFGDSPGGVLFAFLTRPGEVVGLIGDPNRWAYLQTLLGPVLYLSLFSPAALAPALPDLALNLLSNHEWMYRGGAHYSAVIVPFVVIAAIHGTGWIAGLAGRIAGAARRPAVTGAVTAALAGLVLIAGLRAYHDHVARPILDRYPTVTAHHRTGEEILGLIPPEAPVAASSGINPHLSQRRQISLFPEGIDRARYVAIDVTADPYPIDAPSQWWRIRQLIGSGQWGILAARDGFLILERGSTWAELPPEFFSFTQVADPPAAADHRGIFDQAIELIDVDLEPGPDLHGRDPRARLTLLVRPVRPIQEDYRFTVLVTDRPGTIAGQFTNHPATIWLPTSRWQPGATYRIVVDRLSPLGLREALVWLAVDRGDPERLERVAVQPASGVTADPARRAIQIAALRQ